LHYVLGFTQLGHDVWFVEDSDDYERCYDPTTFETSADPTYGLGYARAVFERAGLADRWAYFDSHTGRWLGPAGDSTTARLRDADLLVDVSGANPAREWWEGVPVRVLVDTDPVFTQVRHLASGGAQTGAHTSWFSFAENVGQPSCGVPDDGRPWQPTRQPVVLAHWPVPETDGDGRFTTVMAWDSYPSVDWRGHRFGMKSDSFDPFADLPSRTDAPLAMALGSPTAPRERLAELGWQVDDPLTVTRTPWTFQDYVRRSTAEFTVAKHAYVSTSSGWFSERSANYLASGRPVVTQDTGFGRTLPNGEGLVAFRDPDEAVDAIEAVRANYSLHRKRAREIAELFDARTVLTSLLERAH
jgi:hypothetical protein